MMTERTTQFIDNINALEASNIRDILARTYTNDVVFVDPVKKIEGIEALNFYFEKLYHSVNHCKFELSSSLLNDQYESLQWIMHLRHKKIKSGNDIYLDGASFIEYRDNKVCYQKDYYDLGALIYEQIPILGSVVKKVRNAI